MTNRHDSQDAQLDRNLRTVAERLPLPADTSARQRAAWKSAAASSPIPLRIASEAPELHHGAPRMNFKRLWAMAGSAVAAAVLFSVFLLNLVQPPRVEAAMILRSFQESTHRGLRLTIENLNVEGLRAEGHMRMQFATPVNFAQLLNDPGAVPDPQWMTMDLSVRTDADADDLAGLDLRVAGAFAEDTEWLYLKAGHLPAEVMEELPGPIATWLGSFLGDGILLDLTGLDEEALFGGTDEEAAADAAASGAVFNFTVSTTNNDTSVDADLHSSPAGPGGHRGINLQLSAAGEDEESADAAASAEQAMLALFAGQAGRQQLEEILGLLSEASTDARVVEVSPGLYVLTATGLGHNADDDDPLLATAEMRITYREQVGVESFSLERVGPSQGSIRLEFCDDLTLDDPGLLDRNRVMEAGVTTVIDAAMIQAFVGMFTGG